MASSLAPTFLAALRAVGTASTMAFAGFYIHRRNFVTPSGKKMMALLSQQVTIPAFLFAKIIYCPAGAEQGSDSAFPDDEDGGARHIVCPSVARRISDLWILLVWPFYVVVCGLLVGYLAARFSKTPPAQMSACMAACAFGNSTGLPITLLTVIHKQFRNSKAELGRIDPTALLSVYLLLYPVLQWGLGGWLLAPEEKKEDGVDGKMEGATEKTSLLPTIPQLKTQNQSRDSEKAHRRRHSFHIRHLLNREPLQTAAVSAGQEEFGGVRPRLLSITDNIGPDGSNERQCVTVESSSTLAMMVRELSFTSLTNAPSYEEMRAPRQIRSTASTDFENGNGAHMQPRPESNLEMDGAHPTMDAGGEPTVASQSFIPVMSPPTIHEHVPLANGNAPDAASPLIGRANDYTMLPKAASAEEIRTMQDADILPLTETLLRISGKVFQPPVIGAVLGLFIASFPRFRGLFQDIWGPQVGAAPFKWLFDGVYSVGQAAVPINMIILGINLSSTFKRKDPSKNDVDGQKSKMLSNRTMLAVVTGKMFLMPALGIFSTYIVQKYFVYIPDEIDATCYLVMMIVFITPTANNVMVMVELSGGSSKEGIARLIGWQYVVSPCVLSIVLCSVVTLASCHFDASGKC